MKTHRRCPSRARPVRHRRTAVRAALIAALIGAGAFLAGGCNSKEQRPLNPMEALHYKRQLVRQHWQELSESQRNDLGSYQGRTRADIDGYFERLRSDFARQKASDEKRLREEIEGSGGDGGGGAVSSDPPAGGTAP